MAHANGFFEIKQNNAPLAIEKERVKWEQYNKKVFMDTVKISSFYDAYISLIKSIISNSKTRIIFLTMPVDGKSEWYQQQIFLREDPIPQLMKAFPTAIFIDSGNDPRLSSFKTFEDSHLDGITGRKFSTRLAEVIIHDSFQSSK